MTRVYHILCLAAAIIALPRAGWATPPDYLIVHAAHLADAAQRWADYRTDTGRHVTTYAVQPTANPAELRERIRQHIAAFAAGSRGGTTPAVLLLGDAAPDPGEGLATIPHLAVRADRPDAPLGT